MGFRGLRVWGLVFAVSGFLGFQGSGFRTEGFEVSGQGMLGLRVSGFRVWGFSFRPHGEFCLIVQRLPNPLTKECTLNYNRIPNLI